MLRASLLGLGAGTLIAAAAALYGGGAGGPIEPVRAPRTTYLALGGEIVDLAATNHGLGCIAPMLEQIRRHPSWTIRIDDLLWTDDVGPEPDPARATLVIDARGATWRDGSLPQSLTLTQAERESALAAFALDCRVDESQPRHGFEGRYIGVALGEDGPPIAKIPTNAPVSLRLEKLFDAIRARYLRGRVDDLRGFSIELVGKLRSDYDARGRPIRKPFHMKYDAGADTDPYHSFEDRIRLLDWAMQQPAALPPGPRIARGTLRAYGRSRPLAIAILSLYSGARDFAVFNDLNHWRAVEWPRPEDVPDDTGE